MSRLFITGDTHNNIDIGKLTTGEFREQKELTRDDVLLIAGDFGLPWSYPESNSDIAWLKWHENKNYTTVFVDGNHENFDALVAYPEVKFAGARCHQLRPHIFHVYRGEVLQLAGHTILCMGGADSTDKAGRKEHKSWWKEERPTEEEWKRAVDNLKARQPDIIVTHDAPYTATQRMYGMVHPDPPKTELEVMLFEIIKGHIPVTDWYFGHHHHDCDFDQDHIRFHGRYQQISEVEENGDARDLRPIYER